ncbi:MAG: hypothetical protein F4Y26_10045 [Gammaproteobacteria bacterium]|nr:hypothetical protein [Gammaproteobacteria bacterium]
MEPSLLIAHWSGRLPEGFVHPTVPDEDLPTCRHRRCRSKVAVKRDGTPAHACQRCLDRRAASCRRRRRALAAEGGCRRCGYRKRLEGDFLCQRCRDDRDAERDRKRRDALDAAAIDEFAARPESTHTASGLDCGVSPWNARKPREASASYWSPNPDPHRVLDPEWDTYRRFRRC